MFEMERWLLSEMIKSLIVRRLRSSFCLFWNGCCSSTSWMSLWSFCFDYFHERLLSWLYFDKFRNHFEELVRLRKWNSDSLFQSFISFGTWFYLTHFWLEYSNWYETCIFAESFSNWSNKCNGPSFDEVRKLFHENILYYSRMSHSHRLLLEGKCTRLEKTEYVSLYPIPNRKHIKFACSTFHHGQNEEHYLSVDLMERNENCMPRLSSNWEINTAILSEWHDICQFEIGILVFVPLLRTFFAPCHLQSNDTNIAFFSFFFWAWPNSQHVILYRQQTYCTQMFVL